MKLLAETMFSYQVRDCTAMNLIVTHRGREFLVVIDGSVDEAGRERIISSIVHLPGAVSIRHAVP